MSSNNVTVIYKWTAQPDKLDELRAIYEKVAEAMEQNEPGAEAVHIYVSKDENALYVRDEFKDAAALRFHLQETAAAHFQDLMAIATPGAFYFWGEIPMEIQQAARQMGLQAEFGSHVVGFDR